jgi:ubiquinone/menaquinone biosynthesis C-methylase UbiE
MIRIEFFRQDTIKMATQSSVYTTDHAASVLRTHSWRTAANSAGYLIPHIQPNMLILDIGCGPGSITIDFARLVPHGHVTGVEYVPEPLEKARALASSQGVTNISFEVGDIHSLPFPDNSFDIAHAHQVLQHVADPIQALREMRRVVKSHGIVACRESASMTWYPDSEGLEAWSELSTRMRRAKGGNPNPGSYIHVWAEKAGFIKAKITKSASSWCFSSDEEREYWGGSMEERARSSGFTKIALDEGFSTQADLEKMARGWRDFRQNQDAWFGLLHGEILCVK